MKLTLFTTRKRIILFTVFLKFVFTTNCAAAGWTEPVAPWKCLKKEENLSTESLFNENISKKTKTISNLKGNQISKFRTIYS